MKSIIILFLLMNCCYSMTLKESIDYSLKNSKEYKQIVFELEKAKYSYRASDRDYNPKFSVSGNNSGKRTGSVSQKISSSGSLNIDYSKYINNDIAGTSSFQFSQNIFKWKDYNKKINRLNYEISLINFKKDKNNFILKVINNFYNVLRSQERLLIEQNSYKRWELSLEYAKVKFESGSANKFDLLNAQVNLLSKENTIIQLKDSLEKIKDNFKLLIGIPLSQKFEASEKIIFEKPAKLKLKVRDSLKISILNYEISKLNRKSSKDNSKPNITYSAVYNKNNTKNFWSTAINYSFEFGKSSKDYNYFKSIINAKTQKISLELLKSNIEIEQKDILRKLKTSELSVKLSKKNLQIAEETYDYSKMSFQEGLVDIINLQDAQNKLTSAKQSYIFSLIDNKILNFDYIKIIGDHIEDHL